MTDKAKNNKLIQIADEVLTSTKYLFKNEQMEIPESYNGHVASFGVSIAMSGLKPTVAIYYQDSETKVNRQHILAIIARMLALYDNKYAITGIMNLKDDAKHLLRMVIEGKNKGTVLDEKVLKNDIVDCSIALKQVVRTYKLV